MVLAAVRFHHKGTGFSALLCWNAILSLRCKNQLQEGWYVPTAHNIGFRRQCNRMVLDHPLHGGTTEKSVLASEKLQSKHWKRYDNQKIGKKGLGDRASMRQGRSKLLSCLGCTVGHGSTGRQPSLPSVTIQIPNTVSEGKKKTTVGLQICLN